MKILILAGGLGLRLWPLVHPPKQFFFGDGSYSLLQKTVLRFLPDYSPESIVILTQKSFASLVEDQVHGISPKIQILTEKEKRDTAPALLQALQVLEDEHFLIAPSDHLISPEELFLKKLEKAKEEIEDALGVLFGIFPTSPHTGFGYIQCDPTQEVSQVRQFVEKPSFGHAKAYLEEGKWLWNSGMLLLNRKKFFYELEKIHPEYLHGNCPSVSIDVAFLEHLPNLKVIPLSLCWSDLGSWDAVYETYEKDLARNVCLGNVEISGVKNSLLISTHRPLKAMDIEDILLIESEEGVIAMKRGSSQKIKSFCSFSESEIYGDGSEILQKQ